MVYVTIFASFQIGFAFALVILFALLLAFMSILVLHVGVLSHDFLVIGIQLGFHVLSLFWPRALAGNGESRSPYAGLG